MYIHVYTYVYMCIRVYVYICVYICIYVYVYRKCIKLCTSYTIYTLFMCILHINIEVRFLIYFSRYNASILVYFLYFSYLSKYENL